jgi:hypothetical protein
MTSSLEDNGRFRDSGFSRLIELIASLIRLIKSAPIPAVTRRYL